MTDKPETPDYMKDLNFTNVKKSAKLDILPQLKIPTSESREVVILSEPTITMFADNNEYYTMIVLHNGIKKQFVCQAKSFRYQYAVMVEKGIDLINKTVIISKDKVKMKKYPNAELYSISLVD